MRGPRPNVARRNIQTRVGALVGQARDEGDGCTLISTQVKTNDEIQARMDVAFSFSFKALRAEKGSTEPK